MKIENLNRCELNELIFNAKLSKNIRAKLDSEKLSINQDGGEYEGYIYSIATLDAEVVGFCISTGYLSGGTRDIQLIYTEEMHRRKGIAEALLIEVINNAILNSHKRISAVIIDDNLGLHLLFRKFQKHYENQIEIAWIFSNELF